MTDIERAREIFRLARRPVVFTGAGVSADSGVPTFRGAPDSFWGKYDPMQLASPEGFEADPKLVYDWYSWRRGQLAKVQPNPAHDAIADLQRRAGAVVITQNVDGLHERVAPEGATILRVHGTLLEDRCTLCRHREWIDLAAPPALRSCPVCSAGTMRPDVVWFGENLDPKIWDASVRAIEAADALLVVGTSGEVYPAAGLVQDALMRSIPIVIVNLDPGSMDRAATVALHGRAAEVVPRVLRADQP